MAFPQLRRRHFRFTLRGLMLLTLAAAVGLTRWRVPKGTWTDGVLAAVCVFFVLGLLAQVADLWRALRARSDLSPDLCFAGRFAIAWRLAVVAIIVACQLASVLDAYGVTAVVEMKSGDFLCLRSPVRHAVLLLALLIAAAASPQLTRVQRPRTLFSRVADAVGWMGTAVLVAYIFYDLMTLPMLVYLATAGIELGNNNVLWAKITGVTEDVATRQRHFLGRTALATLFVPVALGATIGLAKSWPRGWGPRIIFGTLIVLGLAAIGAYLEWLYTVGLHRFSPSLAEAGFSARLPAFVAAAALLALSSGVAALRLVQSSSSPNEAGRTLSWRSDEARYLHERGGCLALLAVVVGYHCWLAGYGMSLVYSMPGGPTWSWRDMFEYLTGFPDGPLEVAVVIVAVSGIVRGLWPPMSSAYHALAPLSPARFVVTWLALCATVAGSVIVLYWLTLILWVTLPRW